MEFIGKLFGQQSEFVGSFQIGLDLILVVSLIGAVYFVWRFRSNPKAEIITESLERIIEETKTIAEEFDSNLKERQLLIQQLLSKLDQRVEEAKNICTKLERLKRENHQYSPTSPQTNQSSPANHSDHQKVLVLAQKGLSAEAIAKRLQKPLGEVELILNIQKLSSQC